MSNDNGRTVHKTCLIAQVAERTNLPKIQVAKMLDATLDLISATTEDGGRVVLTGFGVFDRLYRQGRKRRNPALGQEIFVDGHWTPRFMAAEKWRDAVAKSGGRGKGG